MTGFRSEMPAVAMTSVATSIGILGTLAPLLFAFPARAETWPARALTMVAPGAAGSSVDVVARIFSPPLSEALGRQVIVEDMGGAGGMNAAARVAKAAPDGYQFVLGHSGTHAINQTLYKHPLYDAAVDFAPVALIAELPIVLIARSSLPVGNLAGVRDLCKGQPGEDAVRFARSGVDRSARLRAAQRDDRRRRHAHSLSRRRAGDAGSHRRARRLPMRDDRGCVAADREQDGEAARDLDAGSLADPAEPGISARAGLDRFRGG